MQYGAQRRRRQLLRSMLCRTGPLDPTTLAGAEIMLMSVAAAGVLDLVWRHRELKYAVTRTDKVRALRNPGNLGKRQWTPTHASTLLIDDRK